MASSAHWKKMMDYYSEKAQETEKTIEEYTKMKEEIEQKLEKIVLLIPAVGKIITEISDLPSQFGIVSKYLSAVIIDGEPYDHGDFESISNEFDNYKATYDGLNNELLELQDTLTDEKTNIGKKIENAEKQLKSYKEDYEDAKKKYKEALFMEQNNKATEENKETYKSPNNRPQAFID